MSAGPIANTEAPLALICGGGSLPLAVADSVARRGRKVLLFPLQGVARPQDYAGRPHTWVRIAKFGTFERAAQAAGCRDMVLIGSLVRPSIWQLRFDWTTLKFIPRIAAAFAGGDDYLLSSVAKLIEGRGFRVLGAHEVAPEILVPEGTLGCVHASERDRTDVNLGLDYLRATGGFDVGQAVVVAGKYVLAVEAAEGTDGMLARVAEMRANGRVRAPGGTGVSGQSAQARTGPPLRSALDRAADGRARGARAPCRHCRAGRLDHHRRARTADIGGQPRQSVRHRGGGRERAMSATPGPHVFLVAGEDSGDRLGAALIAAMRQRCPGARFSGVGGTQMAGQGVHSLFPLGDLAIIGFAAIPAKLPKILARIRQTADAVIAAKPDVLVVIDSPEFTHRVARRVRTRASAIPIVDYVCPSVWAWRPRRARAMRAYVDHVLALLPFEPAVLQRLGGPPSTFVGHPLSERIASLAAQRRGGDATRRQAANAARAAG